MWVYTVQHSLTLFFQQPIPLRPSTLDHLPYHEQVWFVFAVEDHDASSTHHGMEAHLNDPLEQVRIHRSML